MDFGQKFSGFGQVLDTAWEFRTNFQDIVPGCGSVTRLCTQYAPEGHEVYSISQSGHGQVLII